MNCIYCQEHPNSIHSAKPESGCRFEIENIQVPEVVASTAWKCTARQQAKLAKQGMLLCHSNPRVVHHPAKQGRVSLLMISSTLIHPIIYLNTNTVIVKTATVTHTQREYHLLQNGH
jgi:hypothetical protein